MLSKDEDTPDQTGEMQKSSSLYRKLIIGCLIMLSLSLVLSVSLIFIFQSSYARADRSLTLLTYYRQVLVAANRVSAERGPTNAALGEEPLSNGPLLRKLADFRASSDAALASLLPPALHAEAVHHRFVTPDEIDRVRVQLRQARQAVDELLARPRSDRSTAEIASAINSMIGAVDAMNPVVTDAIVGIVAEDQTLAGPALVAQMLGELRDFVGRLGSLSAPYIAAGKPMPLATQDEINQMRGRIRELWNLAAQQAGLFANDPQLEIARRDVNDKFFGHGLQDLEQVISAGRSSGRFGVTTAEMTDRLVPTFEPVERLRSTSAVLKVANFDFSTAIRVLYEFRGDV